MGGAMAKKFIDKYMEIKNRKSGIDIPQEEKK